MARLPKDKPIAFHAKADYFRPVGVPLAYLKRIFLSDEEVEVLRLVTVDGLGQIDAAKKLGVHQSTVQRILARAEKKLATALIEGKAIELNKHTALVN